MGAAEVVGLSMWKPAFVPSQCSRGGKLIAIVIDHPRIHDFHF